MNGAAVVVKSPFTRHVATDKGSFSNTLISDQDDFELGDGHLVWSVDENLRCSNAAMEISDGCRLVLLFGCLLRRYYLYRLFQRLALIDSFELKEDSFFLPLFKIVDNDGSNLKWSRKMPSRDDDLYKQRSAACSRGPVLLMPDDRTK